MNRIRNINQTISVFLNHLPKDQEEAVQILKSLVFDTLKRNQPVIRDLFAANGVSKTTKHDSYQEILFQLQNQDLLLSAYWISTLYAKVIGKENRALLGAFFTPPDLSKIVIKEVFRVLEKNYLECTFADVCCGGGALLVPMTRVLTFKMKQAGFSSADIVNQVQGCIHGLEIDSFLMFLTRVFLWAELDEHIRASGIEPEFSIKQEDALNHVPTGSPFDVIVGNPPYRPLSKEEDKELKKKYDHIMSWNTNLYPIFLERSLGFLKKEGILSVIIPTSLYTSRNYEKVRHRITHIGHVSGIVWLTNRKGVFHDVLQETSVMTLAYGRPSQKRKTLVRSLQKGFESNFSTYIPARHGKAAWAIPKTREQAEMLNTITKVPFRIADYGYRVRIGHLVWNRDSRKRYYKCPSASKEKGIYPIIWPFNITTSREFDFLRPLENKKERFVKMEKAASGVVCGPSVVMKRTRPSDFDKFLLCCAVPDTFMSKYGGFVGENHVIILEKRPDIDTLSPVLLCRVLNSEPVNLAYRCYSGTISISRYGLENMPLPDPAKIKQCLVDGLDINRAVYRSYGM